MMIQTQYAGVGDVNLSSIVGSSGGLISAGTSIGVTSGLLAAGGSLAAIGEIAGPIGAVAGVLIGILQNVFSGCGQSCTLTSEAANQIGQALQQNLEAYMASGHTKSEQTAALANFDYTWNKLVQYCGNPSFGDAGKRCTSDRQAGACHWKTSPGGWQQSNGQWTYVAPGPSGSGDACWNWFIGQRDPIAKDPTVKPDTPDTAHIGATVQEALGISSTNVTPLLIGAAALMILFVVVSQ